MSIRKMVLSGDEAVAYGAFSAGVRLGSGYPGTPSTEILEKLSSLGGSAEWSPNEKVALEVGIGVSLGGGRSIVTMKHVGMNVAADPLFTFTYMGANGGLVLVSADDPGMASSQNEQDNRNYAKFAQMPMLEPSDSQEAYDFAVKAFEISEKFKQPVLLRMTTRVCHSQGIVEVETDGRKLEKTPFVSDVQNRVMVPAFAKKAHVKIQQKMKDLQAFCEASDFTKVFGDGKGELGVIASGAAFQHVMEACPGGNVLKLGMTWPLPIEKIRAFASKFSRVAVVEEGSRFLEENILASGIKVERKADIFELGELNASRVAKLLKGDTSPEQAGAPGRPPALCPGCPHRKTFELLHDLKLIVSGDIGCYTLGVMPPFSAIEASVCMGASIGVGLGLRHALPEDDARKVVSIIGDSTFMHSGLTGIAEMVYNKPSTGHVVLVLDNSTTAMTGLQEHSATGRHLDMSSAKGINIENVVRAMGVDNVDVIDPIDREKYETLLKTRLASNDASVIIVRRPCLLQMKKIAKIARKEEVKK